MQDESIEACSRSQSQLIELGNDDDSRLIELFDPLEINAGRGGQGFIDQ